MLSACVAAAVAVSSNQNPTPRDEITSLPGWSGKLPSRMYNGWIDAGVPPNGVGTMFFHYWFVESEGDPSSDPILLWYNGGPGASSLFGLLVELGPLLLNDDSIASSEYHRSGIPQLQRNQFSWSQRANLLIVDNPPPVGFSFCFPAGPAGNGTSCGPWDDSSVAAANHAFLIGWQKQWPEFVGRDVFLSGESYAGIYVPMIADRVLKDPQGIKLAGFAVGDGCMGTEVLCGRGDGGPYYNLEFLHGHGQFSNKLYNSITSTCTEEDLKSGNLSDECKKLVAQVDDEVGGYYGYNLYDTCPHDGPFTRRRRTWGLSKTATLAGAENDYPCPGNAMGEWLNHSSVRNALHVQADANFFSGDNGVGFNYNVSEPTVLPIWLNAVKNPELRTLAYNGDTDPGINSFVAQDRFLDFFDSVDVAETARWRPWTVDGKDAVGGYVVEREGNFSFLTIRGSGHMVPEFKPEAANVMINTFLEGGTYPLYNKLRSRKKNE